MRNLLNGRFETFLLDIAIIKKRFVNQWFLNELFITLPEWTYNILQTDYNGLTCHVFKYGVEINPGISLSR